MISFDPYEPFGRHREVTVDPARTLSPEEYLTFERASETRHEYFDGRVFAMTGGTRRHGRIIANLIVLIGMHVRGTPCHVHPSTMRVKVRATGLYTYPDISVDCGTSELEDEHEDTLLSPVVLIEVLSPSTERYDRGRKAEHYRTIESLREYLLVSQDQPRIERYARAGAGVWTLTEAIGMEAGLALDSIGCTLRLSEGYADID